MPAPIDITGQKYGRLTAVHLTESKKPRKWVFVCDCGNLKISSPASVRNGQTRSCGCLRKDVVSTMRSVDLAGQTVGRLTVLRKLEERNKHGCVRWLCSCSCGGSVSVTSRALMKSDPTGSCGCIKRERFTAMAKAQKQENPYSRSAEYRAAKKKAYRARPEYAMAGRLSRLMSWAMKQVGGIKTSPTLEMLGYSADDLRQHIERQFVKGMSWANRGEWELDHITPISSAKTVEDVIRLNCLSNLRPMWAIENNRKNHRRTHLV